MKTEINQLPLELCETVISALREVPKNVQLYWARNKEMLVKALNQIKDFEPVTFPDSPAYLLPATKAVMRKILWRKRLIDTHDCDHFERCIIKHQPPQPECLVRSIHVNVELNTNELFDELGVKHANDFASSAFSYSQIVSLTERHKDEKKKGSILFYEGANYFPLMLPTGNVEFMSFRSRRPNGKHAGWRGWFMGSDPYFRKGKLLLREKI